MLSACTPPQAFTYQVLVKNGATGSGVPRVAVNIDFGSRSAPTGSTTDANGYAIFTLAQSLAGQTGKIIVEARGFNRLELYVPVNPNSPTESVELQPLSPSLDITGATVPPTVADPKVPLPTITPTQIPRPAETREPTSTPPAKNPIPTPTVPTETSTLTPIPASPEPTLSPTDSQTNQAVAKESASIYNGTDSSCAQLGIINKGESVTVLGRSAEGTWLYAIDSREVKGFISLSRLNWLGNFDTLPIFPSPACTPQPPANTTTPDNYPSLGVDLWALPDTASCKGGKWHVLVFIRGQGGNGIYTYYWNDIKVAGPLINDGATFQVSNAGGGIIVTGKVSSGDGQIISKNIYVESPISCK